MAALEPSLMLPNGNFRKENLAPATSVVKNGFSLLSLLLPSLFPGPLPPPPPLPPKSRQNHKLFMFFPRIWTYQALVN